jgi:hypothetical protein
LTTEEGENMELNTLLDSGKDSQKKFPNTEA